MNTELIARLEAAEVGSRELDVRMVAACNPSEWGVGDLEIALEDPDGRLNPQHYTTSLDSALALAERFLDLGSWRIERESENSFWVKLWWSNNDRSFHSYSNAKTAPLALNSAILRALDAQGQK